MNPIVAIVGRANVGKSRLFNRIAGSSRALVGDMPGVTRDRHYTKADWRGKEFILVDTGGIDLDPDADFERKVTDQSLIAIKEADVIVVVFDGQMEPTLLDEEIVRKLRAVSTPVVYVVNKIDLASHEGDLAAYHRLRVHPLIGTSAEHGRGVDDLLEKVIEYFPVEEAAAFVSPQGHRIAVVGKPNVGKSTLINRLAGEERVVAHELPGTTRDAIDVDIAYNDHHYILVDTAGIRRRARLETPLEKVTALRSLRVIERSDIVLQLIDGAEGVTRQDQTLSSYIQERGRGLILLVNKWDCVKKLWKEYEQDLRGELKDLRDIPVERISAKTGKGCLNIFPAIDRLEADLEKKLPTSELNRVLELALASHHLPTYRGKTVRIYYGTQTGTRPPTFTLFSNYPQAVPYAYRRYLIHQLKQALGVTGVPLKVIMRHKT